MARIYRKTARPSKRTRTCRGCSKPIEPGQDYYLMTRRPSGRGRGIDYFRHVACGSFTPTERSNRKTARIEEASNEASNAISSWGPALTAYEPGETIEIDYAELKDAIASVAEAAREVGEEYRESFDNMPVNLQYGGTGSALEEVSDELESYADERESWEPSADSTFEVPDRDEDEDEEQWRDRVEQDWNDRIEEIRGEADDQNGDWPEYQG